MLRQSAGADRADPPGRQRALGGADLAALFHEVGIDPRARFLWSYGRDGGTFAGTPCDWYVKDMPLARISAGDVLLAYEVNGAPLPPEHGFPVRLVIPGYFGTNSVKWLWRLHLAEQRAGGLFTTRFYNDATSADDVAAGLPPQRPIWATVPESIIVAPAPDSTLALGEPAEIWGWAWSFRGIAQVDVSLDGGASFVTARLEEKRGFAWQRFALPWRPAERGEALLCARAFETAGAGQPRDGARNAMHTVPVVVR